MKYNTPYAQYQSDNGGGCWGIGGIIASVVLGFLYMASIMLAGVMQLYNPAFMDSEGGEIIIGVCILGLMGVNAFVLVLSMIVIFTKKGRTLAIIATAFNAIEIVGILALIVVGNMMD